MGFAHEPLVVEGHKTRIVATGRDDANLTATYHAECECGWRHASERIYRQSAQDDARWHLNRTADGLGVKR